MNTLDKVQIVGKAFLKIAILWWPLTLFIIGVVSVGVIKESKIFKR